MKRAVSRPVAVSAEPNRAVRMRDQTTSSTSPAIPDTVRAARGRRTAARLNMRALYTIRRKAAGYRPYTSMSRSNKSYP